MERPMKPQDMAFSKDDIVTVVEKDKKVEDMKEGDKPKEDIKISPFKKFLIKKLYKKGKKKLKVFKKETDEKKLIRTKDKLIDLIWSLTDIFNLYEDSERTIPMSQGRLRTMEVDALIEYFEELLEEMEKVV